MKNFVVMLGGIGLLISCAPKAQEGAASKEVISVPDMPALGPYSSAVRAGGMLYVSGTIAFDAKIKSFAPANIEDQTRQVFTNLSKVLGASNCTLEDIIKTNVYLKDPADFTKMNAVYALYFPNYKPARTTVPGVDWGRDDILIEIDVIANCS